MQMTTQAGAPVAGVSVKGVLRERIGLEIELLSRRLTTSEEANGTRPYPRKARMQARVRWFGQLLAGLSDAQELHLYPDVVGFGSTVVATNLDSGERASFTLMSGSSMDVTDDQVSLESPIGRALAGRRSGEEIVVEMPGGLRRFRIESVKTLLERFGLQRTFASRDERL